MRVTNIIRISMCHNHDFAIGLKRFSMYTIAEKGFEQHPRKGEEQCSSIAQPRIFSYALSKSIKYSHAPSKTIS